MVLSFSSAAEAMMFSVGWQAQQRTTSVREKSIYYMCNIKDCVSHDTHAHTHTYT